MTHIEHVHFFEGLERERLPNNTAGHVKLIFSDFICDLWRTILNNIQITLVHYCSSLKIYDQFFFIIDCCPSLHDLS